MECVVTYIWHDCFVVGTPGVTMVFDYWLDADGERRREPGFLKRIPQDRPLIVFVSHSHKDHFNSDIFAWASLHQDVRYVVSSDVMRRIRHVVSPTSVYAGPKVDAARVVRLAHGESTCIDGVRVSAYRTTDTGNAYMINIGDVRIFHAGDLNEWAWRDESEPDEVRKAVGDFRACLRDIRESLRSESDAGGAGETSIDLCFFPVDSRIGSGYAEGARKFVREFDVARFFPMHFALGDSAERAVRLADALRFFNYANMRRGEYIPLALPGSQWIGQL